MGSVLSILTWLKGPNGALLFAALFAVSEFLDAIPGIQASSIWKAIRNGIKTVYDRLRG